MCDRMMCGSGFYLFSFTATAFALISLIGLKRWEKKISKDWYQEMVVISEDVEGQVERIQAIIDKYDSKVTRFGVKRNLREKEITVNFRLRSRAIHPPRDMYGEVFGLQGIKQIELKSPQ